MSSLSSLLNPNSNSDALPPQDDAAQQQGESHHSPTDQRKPSLPSIAHVQSPEQHHVSLPHYTPPPNRSSPPQAQDAIQAWTKLSASTAPLPAQWGDYTAPADVQQPRRESLDRRPGSAHSPTIELPPPPPIDAQRKPSSPTLDQYHVASRSPEQRRPSVVSSGNAASTLPPLQNVTSPIDAQMRRPSAASTRGLSPTSARATQMFPGSPADADESFKAGVHAESSTSQAPVPSLVEPSDASKEDMGDLSPAHIKQEALAVPQTASSIDARRPSLQINDMEPSKAVSSLKRENSARHQSPLRESSVPMPSTEDAESTISRKRPLPKKKGTATTMKKAPPSKKRKLESTRSDTPSSRMSRPAFKTGSSKGTPINSSPAPSNRSNSLDPDDDEEEEEEEEGTPVSDDLYCLCRRPDTGTFMIGCDGCDDWFHGKCVSIEERDKNLIDKFMCPRCTEAGTGRTTWKRICRRSGCRLPARVGKNKQGNDGSKYCSDQCGVTFFRQMTATARGNEQAGKNRSTRRKSAHVPSDSQASSDLGARGGVLAPAEVRALLDSSQSLDDFKKLGEGVLSPPATPDGKPSGGDTHRGDYTEAETQRLAEIISRKDASRVRHQLLKDRQLFINMTKQAASRACAENELKPKEYCGFDPRLEWSEEQFAIWRASPIGEQAFTLGTLAIEQSGDESMIDEGDDNNEGVFAHVNICDKKKCARHLEWVKLATDDVRFEMSDNSDRMRGLDREEREIRERATLRMRSGGELQGEGSVEVHDSNIQSGVRDDGKGQETIVAPAQPAPESVVPALPLSEAMQVDTTS